MRPLDDVPGPYGDRHTGVAIVLAGAFPLLEHAIAVLIGENPSSFHLEAKPLWLDGSPPAIDPGLPSALLERRPDVAAAERRVAAANFNIGVAIEVRARAPSCVVLCHPPPNAFTTCLDAHRPRIGDPLTAVNGLEQLRAKP